MKVLWVCNVIFPEVSKYYGVKASSGGGWQNGLLKAIKNQSGVELSVCVPSNKKVVERKKVENIDYYSYYQKTNCLGMSDFLSLNDITFKNFLEIIERVQPDVLQVFGTEYPHCLQAIRAFNKPERTIVHIQGVLNKIANDYYAGIPERYQKMFVPSSIFRGTIHRQKNVMVKRAKIENQILKSVNNVIGRTKWDYEAVLGINGDLKYFKCNELLRDSFYDCEWQYEKCSPYTIFVSQGTYPLKGLHKLIEAVAIVKKTVPEVKLFVAGNNPIKTDSLKGRLTISSYGVYLRKLISTFHLEKDIIFLGVLAENDMKKWLLKSNVFVLPSAVENSSNSLGEAMLLGVPCVAANTGGTPSIISDEEGFLYRFSDINKLAEILIDVMNKQESELKEISVRTRAKALEIFDRERVVYKMRDIYDKVFLNK